MSDPKYPMCERLAGFKTQISFAHEFIEFCESKGVRLMKLIEPAGERDFYTEVNLEKTLYEFFEIDAKILEKERRTMLEECQKAANKR